MLRSDVLGINISYSVVSDMFAKTERETIATFAARMVPDELIDAVSIDYLESCTLDVISEKIEVEDIMSTARECKFHYLDDATHPKNAAFSYNYYMNDRQIRDILNDTKAEDYCYSVKYKKSTEKEGEDIFHIFTPDILLLNRDTYELVHLYIKFKFIYNENGEKEVVIVACHKRMFDPKRPFR